MVKDSVFGSIAFVIVFGCGLLVGSVENPLWVDLVGILVYAFISALAVVEYVFLRERERTYGPYVPQKRE